MLDYLLYIIHTQDYRLALLLGLGTEVGGMVICNVLPRTK